MPAKLTLVVIQTTPHPKSALFVNDIVIEDAHTHEEGVKLRNMALNLHEALDTPLHEHLLDEPADSDWIWLDVLELLPPDEEPAPAVATGLQWQEG